MNAVSALTKIAAECHRAKWQFDFSEEDPPTRLGGCELLRKAFAELHRIGDEAMKLSNQIKAEQSSGWQKP